MDKVTKEALDLVQGNGIVFIDELDKIAGSEGKRRGCVARRRAARYTSDS